MKNQQEFAKIVAKISDENDMLGFLQEITTEKELKDMALRWQLLQELNNGVTQRAIASKYGISLCKITRGSKILANKNSIVKKILDKREEDE